MSTERNTKKWWMNINQIINFVTNNYAWNKHVVKLDLRKAYNAAKKGKCNKVCLLHIVNISSNH